MGEQNNSANTSLTVSQLTEIIKDLLEGSLPNICVEGEISNYKPTSSGHIYFTLKDDKSAISAALFKYSAQYLRFQPKDGMKVRIKGSLSVYPPRGTYSINVKSMEEIGSGNIYQILEERKKRLEAEGLFDKERKQRIPLFPTTVGIVSSANGAGTKDVIKIMHNRNPKINIVVLPCLVQGSEAAQDIARQIKTANDFDMCDVLIVGRGGGSLEDLLPFSEECVVRAVAESHIPVISAVGHEIDVSISDFAADLRASTPSNAAELVTTPTLAEIENLLSEYQANYYREITSRIDSYKALVKGFSTDNLEIRFRAIEAPVIQRLDYAKEELINGMKSLIEKRKNQLKLASVSLEHLDPKAILARGYSVVYDKESGKIIKNMNQISENQILEIAISDGTFQAEVKNGDK